MFGENYVCNSTAYAFFQITSIQFKILITTVLIKVLVIISYYMCLEPDNNRKLVYIDFSLKLL